ncbi:12637_t:CDS:1, partial [Ambispora leptoticha]
AQYSSISMKLGALALYHMVYLSKPLISVTGFGDKGGGDNDKSRAVALQNFYQHQKSTQKTSLDKIET